MTYLSRSLDTEGYEMARDIWLRHIERRSNDVDLLASAGEFIASEDQGQAEAFYESAQTLEPSNPAWPERLGRLHWIAYWMAVNSGTKAERSDSARRALTCFEAAHALRDDTDEEQFYGLENLAQMAFEAGETDKARRYADEFLRDAVGREEDDFYGNAIHYGHIVLGRIALREGDITKAKEHLLAAGTTPGSPTLNSYGPDLILAQELVEQGDREAFLEYGRRCARFWSLRGSCLERWTATVEQGGIPEFQLDRLLDADERPTG